MLLQEHKNGNTLFLLSVCGVLLLVHDLDLQQDFLLIDFATLFPTLFLSLSAFLSRRRRPQFATRFFLIVEAAI